RKDKRRDCNHSRQQRIHRKKARSGNLRATRGRNPDRGQPARVGRTEFACSSRLSVEGARKVPRPRDGVWPPPEGALARISRGPVRNAHGVPTFVGASREGIRPGKLLSKQLATGDLLTSHSLGQSAVCSEKGTFVYRCFVAQCRFSIGVLGGRQNRKNTGALKPVHKPDSFGIAVKALAKSRVRSPELSR